MLVLAMSPMRRGMGTSLQGGGLFFELAKLLKERGR